MANTSRNNPLLTFEEKVPVGSDNIEDTESMIGSGNADVIGPQLFIATYGNYCLWSSPKLGNRCTMDRGENIALLGDSTMWRLSKNFAFREASRETRHSTRCGLATYLGAPRADNWTLPSAVQGPVKYGLQHHFCADCSGCDASLTANVEYIPVEFANDVEIQTNSLRTTQEVVGEYLSKNNKDVCFVSAGFHDLAISNLTEHGYVKNVLRYISLLRDGCTRIIWKSMSATRDDTSFPQRNLQIRAWNKAVRASLPTDVAFLDVYSTSASGKWKHADNVHMEWGYYRALGNALGS